ncbi:hypothetical protein [Herpetosiphon sp. NSE202]|uniref:hypothetical protein n=1 Tax=Herpetosiphon sp. NSE202 TaxID=3351349 RepID=UPI003624B72D
MTRYFTHYWTNTTWEEARSQAGAPIGYLFSNFFRTKSIQAGDEIYVVTNIRGNIYLLGKHVVGQIGDRESIRRLLGWAADEMVDDTDHSSASHATAMDFDRMIPLEIAKKLQFWSGRRNSRIRSNLAFKTPTIIDQQTLPQVRELTAESAALLDDYLQPLIELD